MTCHIFYYRQFRLVISSISYYAYWNRRKVSIFFKMIISNKHTLVLCSTCCHLAQKHLPALCTIRRASGARSCRRDRFMRVLRNPCVCAPLNAVRCLHRVMRNGKTYGACTPTLVHLVSRRTNRMNDVASINGASISHAEILLISWWNFPNIVHAKNHAHVSRYDLHELLR